MSSSQVQRYLRTVELYKEIIDLIPESALDESDEAMVRGKLDAIFAQGKIEGRLTAYADGRIFGGIFPEQDRLIADWQRIVDGA